MSESYAEDQPVDGGSPLTRKYGGIPGWVILGGAGVLAYFLFFRNSGSSGSSTGSGGTGTPTTGNITLNPGTTTISVQNPVSSTAQGPGQKQGHGTRNPQPRPPVKPKKSTTSTSVAHKAGPQYVTVGKWNSTDAPWNSTLTGIAAHFHTTIADLMKLNPSIKNPNLIYAGSKLRVP